jgi:hypothetical protein
MKSPRDPAPTDAQMRAALAEHLEAVMSATDTERELARFKDGQRERTSRFRLMSTAAAAVVGLALVGGYLAFGGTDSSPAKNSAAGSTGRLTGELDLVIRDWRTVELGRSDQKEDRDGVVVGTITVNAGGRHAGRMRLDQSTSSVATSNGATVQHAWGTVSATIDGRDCTGTYGYSYYYEPYEAGGALQLRCSDGSVLGARMNLTEEVAIGNTNDWRVHVRLDDGFWVEG